MASAHPGRAFPRRRVLWLCIGVLGVLLVAASAWIGVRAVLLRTELDAAVTHAKDLQAQLEASDVAAAESSAEKLAVRAQTAAGLTGDPVWRAAELVPFVGPNLTA